MEYEDGLDDCGNSVGAAAEILPEVHAKLLVTTGDLGLQPVHQELCRSVDRLRWCPRLPGRRGRGPLRRDHPGQAVAPPRKANEISRSPSAFFRHCDYAERNSRRGGRAVARPDCRNAGTEPEARDEPSTRLGARRCTAESGQAAGCGERDCETFGAASSTPSRRRGTMAGDSVAEGFGGRDEAR